jgi:glycosyltransferase involved in cell wall biosynthesis
MACGVPVVQPRHGAFPEILEKTGGGILVDSDDNESLAEGIASLAKDRSLAQQLGQKGAEGVRAHYEARQMAHQALQVYETLCRRHVGVTTSPSGEKTA